MSTVSGTRILDKEKSYYTIRDLIESGFASRTAIWRMMKDGELDAITVGSNGVRIPRESLEKYEREHTYLPSSSIFETGV